jgi:hypothetical protein
MSDQQQPTRVVVTDLQMPFGSMVVFMVKWAFAAIPAALILLAAITFGGAVFNGILVSIRTAQLAADTAPIVSSQTNGAAPHGQAGDSNVPQLADRCKGNPDPVQCMALEKRLAAETPEQKAARRKALENERRANMEKIR